MEAATIQQWVDEAEAYLSTQRCHPRLPDELWLKKQLEDIDAEAESNQTPYYMCEKCGDSDALHFGGDIYLCLDCRDKCVAESKRLHAEEQARERQERMQPPLDSTVPSRRKEANLREIRATFTPPSCVVCGDSQARRA